MSSEKDLLDLQKWFSERVGRDYSIEELRDLEVLFLVGEQLTSLPESIGCLSNLKVLNLSSNQLTSLPESISDLSSLKILYLESNQLTSLPFSVKDLNISIHFGNNPLVTNNKIYSGFLVNSETVLSDKILSVDDYLLSDNHFDICLLNDYLNKINELSKLDSYFDLKQSRVNKIVDVLESNFDEFFNNSFYDKFFVSNPEVINELVNRYSKVNDSVLKNKYKSFLINKVDQSKLSKVLDSNNEEFDSLNQVITEQNSVELTNGYGLLF